MFFRRCAACLIQRISWFTWASFSISRPVLLNYFLINIIYLQTYNKVTSSSKISIFCVLSFTKQVIKWNWAFILSWFLREKSMNLYQTAATHKSFFYFLPILALRIYKFLISFSFINSFPFNPLEAHSFLENNYTKLKSGRKCRARALSCLCQKNGETFC